jgi:hypothetical protein
VAAVAFQNFWSFELLTNNTTSVTAVAAPSSGVNRVLRVLTVFNNDTVNATVKIIKLVSGTSYVLFQATLVPGQTFEFGNSNEFQALDATTKSITVVLAGAITTNQLQIVANGGDYF